MSRRKPLIGTRENDQEVGFSGGSLLIGKAMQTGAAPHFKLRPAAVALVAKYPGLGAPFRHLENEAAAVV